MQEGHWWIQMPGQLDQFDQAWVECLPPHLSEERRIGVMLASPVAGCPSQR